MADTFSTFDFNVNDDKINYSALPDLQYAIDVFDSAYRDGDVILKQGKRSIAFDASLTCFTDEGGDTAITKYNNLLALQGTISTLTVWTGTAYSNVLLHNVGSPKYTNVNDNGVVRIAAIINLTFRKVE